MSEGRWDKVLQEMKPGDFVLIQFSHNDGGPRGSLRGAGEETKEVTDKAGKTELQHTLGWYLRKYIADTQEKKATPIVCSLTVRNLWPNDRIERDMGNFSATAKEVAETAGVRFVDSANISADEFEHLGKETIAPLFTDRTHTTAEGAQINARAVLAGLKGLNDKPLDQFLSEAGRAVDANEKYVEK